MTNEIENIETLEDLAKEQWRIYMEAERRIEQDGRYIRSGYAGLKAHPAVQVQKNCIDSLIRIERMRQQTNKGKPATDPLAEFHKKWSNK